MFTRCPSCHTLFRIQPQQLKAARGRVRCGQCQTTFDALPYLVSEEELSDREKRALTQASKTEERQWQLPFDEQPPPPLAAQPQAPSVTSPQREQPATESAPRQAEMAPPIPEEPAAAPTAPEPAPQPPEPVGLVDNAPLPPEEEPQEAEVEVQAPAPAGEAAAGQRYSLPEAEAGPPPSLLSRLAWLFATALMLVVLAGQLIYAYRDTLALDPRWRPWLEQGCNVVGCTLPVQRDLSSIEMIERTVVSHPKYQNALLITATLLNKAPFAQPYPRVELTMTDLNQKVVASRLFKPSEYLKDADPRKLFAAGGAVQLQLEIADPGEDAVGFEFNFY